MQSCNTFILIFSTLLVMILLRIHTKPIKLYPSKKNFKKSFISPQNKTEISNNLNINFEPKYSDISNKLLQIKNQTYPNSIYTGPEDPFQILLDKFNFTGNDVIIHVHIQKTGGTTFGKHLAENLGHCRKVKKDSLHYQRMNCDRGYKGATNQTGSVTKYDSWLFSRYSPKWMCGLHQGVAGMDGCVHERLVELLPDFRVDAKLNLHWITNIREPVARFLSEWKHVQRGAIWNSINQNFANNEATMQCGGDEYETKFINKCYPNKKNWSGVTLSNFLSCPFNLAFNRQTRMLSNLQDIGCHPAVYPVDFTDDQFKNTMDTMLASAKLNMLHKFRYFQINEEQRLSQFLFEKTFGVEFDVDFLDRDTIAAKSGGDVSDAEMDLIEKLNKWDIELYVFARSLFFERVRTVL